MWLFSCLLWILFVLKRIFRTYLQFETGRRAEPHTQTTFFCVLIYSNVNFWLVISQNSLQLIFNINNLLHLIICYISIFTGFCSLITSSFVFICSSALSFWLFEQLEDFGCVSWIRWDCNLEFQILVIFMSMNGEGRCYLVHRQVYHSKLIRYHFCIAWWLFLFFCVID